MKPVKLIIILCCTFALGLISYITINNSANHITLDSGTLYPEDYKQIAPFKLTTSKNEIYSVDNFKNKWTLLFFGFTHCPDACPTSLVTMQQIEQKINTVIPDNKIAYVFVSVDPKRDTSEKLDAYVSYFNAKFTGVTGAQTELKKLASSLAAFYITPDAPADEHYLVEHSASIYLIGDNARPKALFSYPHTADKMAADLIRLYKS